jgi:predicted DNA-binding transcriptional regulator AlpA
MSGMDALSSASDGSIAPDLPLLLTRDEVAAWASVSVRAVQDWERRGILQPVRLGPRTVRFRESDLLALLGPNNDERRACDAASGPARLGVDGADREHRI